MDRVEAVVVGAGVVGLAIGRELARRGREVLVLEAASLIGSGTSARNSEVIHAGIYYPQNSLKANLCVRGRDLLYQFVRERGIPHRQCGKLIVTTSASQHDQLHAIMTGAERNGVTNLKRLSVAEATEREPEVHCTAALWSPSTGVVDSHALMLGLLGDIEDHGGAVVLDTPVLSATMSEDGMQVTTGGPMGMTLVCDALINAAGLTAPQLAANLDVALPPPPRPHYAKGSYYSLTGKSPFSHLVYPVPEPGTAGLGVHATVDLAGRTRFGPDVEWLTDADVADAGPDSFPDSVYNVDKARARLFYDAIRLYWPGLQDGQLQADYSGVRPKLTGPSDTVAADFRIDTARRAGYWGGAIALYGIESPGLTSSMALAEHVCSLLEA
eukprot:m.207493 g.207493  ORF g.207493 m.207493 type:complete len:384 (+) comp23793_c0_seq1:318-1469(+)